MKKKNIAIVTGASSGLGKEFVKLLSAKKGLDEIWIISRNEEKLKKIIKNVSDDGNAIIFIDEIDAVGRQRGAGMGGGHDEREQTLNQLLVEMDGFDENTNIIVIAATNRPDILDNALLRPGRFDRQIYINAPDVRGREQILKVHAKNKQLEPEVDLKTLAKRTPGFTGADLQNLLNEAALLAARKNKEKISMGDIDNSIDRVIAGIEKKSKVLTDEDKELTSYHEVGHALVSALQKNTEPVQKITIVPRTMGALGYTLQTPEEEKYLETKDELLAKITTYMAGRAAEVLVFESATSGAANDIEQATKIARAMVTMYGMSDKFGMMCLATVENQYLDGRAGLICGEDTAGQIDKEVLTIINESYETAMNMLRENRDVLDHISEYLYEKETITGKEFMKIFREMKGIPEEESDKKDSLMPETEGAKQDEAKAPEQTIAPATDDMFEE